MDNIDRRMNLHIIVGIQEVVFNILAVSNLDDENIRTTLSKVIRRNEIEYNSLVWSTYHSPDDYDVMIRLIEKKMLEEDIEIYIFSVMRVPLASERQKLTKTQIILLIMFGLLVICTTAHWIAKGIVVL